MIRVVQIVQPSVNLICACAAGRLKQFGRDLHLSSAGALSTSLCVTDTEVRDESMNASQAKGSQGRSTGDTTPQPTSETFRFAPQSGAKTQNKSVDALAPSSGLLTTRVSHHLGQAPTYTKALCPKGLCCQYCAAPCSRQDSDHESHRCRRHLNW